MPAPDPLTRAPVSWITAPTRRQSSSHICFSTECRHVSVISSAPSPIVTSPATRHRPDIVQARAGLRVRNPCTTTKMIVTANPAPSVHGIAITSKAAAAIARKRSGSVR